MFGEFPHETVTLIKKDGTQKIFEAHVQREMIFTEDTSVPIEYGDEIERKLPNGLAEVFFVTDPGFYRGSDGIDDHYQTKVQLKASRKPTPAPVQNTFHVSGTGNRIYQNSTDQSTNTITINTEIKKTFGAMRELVEKNSDGSTKIAMLEKLGELEGATDQKTASGIFGAFMGLAANGATLWQSIAEYIPKVSDWVKSLPL